MKVIAFYLPQFHEIPENNEWWGEGYTEWTAVKAAEPIYYKHVQPNVPLHDNYYNLLKHSVMRWQADCANKAGLEGFCFYHYWFKGRLLLEKPIENYLKWKDISFPYCLSWANDSWIRTWSNVKESGNVWNEKLVANTCDSIYLVKQDYGNEEDWKEHFEYLLPFFRDERYLKKDGKPIFNIYKPHIIPCIKELMCLWKRLAKEAGLNGIYFIATDRKADLHGCADAYLQYEPGYTSAYDKTLQQKGMLKIKRFLSTRHQIPSLYSYDHTWKKILKRKIGMKSRRKVYRGAFINYDETPRRGKNAVIYYGACPAKFEKYFFALDKIVPKDDFVFLTAWNEWGEGAYCEPDERWGYGYLKALRHVLKKD